MPERCNTAAVLGAGVMGAGIAAHFAGAGIRTHLLDIVPPDLKGDELKDPKARNRFAENGIAGALKAKPAAFYDPDAARLITPGNFDDHLDRLGECDLIVEAVVERMDIKKSLFGKVANVVKPDAIIASNTSGLSIAEIGEDLPEDVQKLVDDRQAARAAKDWARSDRLRDAIQDLGYTVQDTKDGMTVIKS